MDTDHDVLRENGGFSRRRPNKFLEGSVQGLLRRGSCSTHSEMLRYYGRKGHVRGNKEAQSCALRTGLVHGKGATNRGYFCPRERVNCLLRGCSGISVPELDDAI